MAMGDAIEKLMKRLGFVKLGRYGLALTFDDRVTTQRPVVLDDGTGGRIVGWKDNDLAQADLAVWPAGHSLVASPQQPQQATQHAQSIAPPVMRRPTAPPPMPPMPPMPMMPTRVEPPPLLDVEADEEPDEDWEWTLAAARARAVEEDVIVRPPTAPQPVVAPAPSLPPSRPVLVSVPAEATTAKTVPLRVARIPELAPTPASASTSARPTVIPVPTLPRYAHTSHPSVYRPEPVVRAQPQPAAPETRRYPRGTAPIDDAAETSTQVQALRDDEHTATAIQRAPTAVSAGGIPSVKQRMAGR